MILNKKKSGVKLEDVALAGGGFAEIFRATLSNLKNLYFDYNLILKINSYCIGK